MTYEMITDGHLGGYIKGGDPATYYPDLWSWMVNELGIESVIDVGCGEGHALQYFRDLGCRVLGIDGMPQDDSEILLHDYTRDAYVPDNYFDLGWSCEFVEHVEEQYLDNFMDTFSSCNMVAVTHAVPGQPGWHHVNCQDDSYWIDIFADYGFVHDDYLTKKSREIAGINDNPYNHFVRSGLMFIRIDPLEFGAV